MALADRIDRPPRRRNGLPCGVQVLLDRLKDQPKELAAFEQMMASTSWSAVAIRKAAADEGYEVSAQTIGRHRTESCRCFL